jgi:hypothetical protein
MNDDHLDTEEITQRALQTCEKLRAALRDIETSVKTARTPIEEGELDFVTVRGELIDMDYYLMHARHALGSMQNAFMDVIGFARRTLYAYDVVYQAWQSAQADVQNAAREAELRTLRRLIDDLEVQAAAIANMGQASDAHTEDTNS